MLASNLYAISNWVKEKGKDKFRMGSTDWIFPLQSEINFIM